MKRKFTGIEVFRLIFAMLIPILHISFTDNIYIYIIRQYLCRLGVPFFFAISGMFLSKKLKKGKNSIILINYLKKYIFILLFWSIIYFPFFVIEGISIREYIFKTPGFLWYLTSMIVAVIPFCLIKKRKVLFIISIILYLFGTMFGDTYGILFHVYPLIKNTIITTRNGLFFGLPMLCIGELVWYNSKAKKQLVFSAILLILEISFVGIWGKAYDRSMYFTLPLFMLYFVRFIKEWNPSINVNYIGNISSLMYFMQYGIINCFNLAFSSNYLIFCYLTIIIFPFIINYFFKDNCIFKYTC